MPAQFLRKTANVSDLRFDLRNPRLIRDATNQEEALKALALLEGPSCVELLKDIIREDGLSPLDNIGIVEENSESIVLEGNRRLLALLLLGRNEDAIEALPKNKHKTVRQLLEKAPHHQKCRSCCICQPTRSSNMDHEKTRTWARRRRCHPMESISTRS